MHFIPYLATVGSLQYLATITQPDIAYAVFYLGCFNHNSHPEHWTAVKHLLRYLKGTLYYKLVYSKSDNSKLFQTYLDASHGGCKQTGHSTSRYATVMGEAAIG